MREVIQIVSEYFVWALTGLMFFYYIFSFAFSPRKKFKQVSRKFHYTFDGVKFSGEKIYNGIEAAIKVRKMSDVSFNRVTYKSVSVLSESREYLQIHRHDHVALICAAPFGTDYFISYWLGEPSDFMEELLIRLPLIGPRIEKAFAKRTFYQIDTETVFLETVKQCIVDSVDALTEEKGIRPLSEQLRQVGAIREDSIPRDASY